MPYFTNHLGKTGVILACLVSFAGPARASNPIVVENAQPGSPASEWDVPNNNIRIEGFTTEISVTPGQTVYFKINTDAAAYELRIYRMGYYGGLGARRVATVAPSVALPQTQPACLFEQASGLIDCGNWTTSAAWQVPATAVSGIYFAKAVRPDTGAASHIVFIVRDEASRSDIVFQTPDQAWQAYNYYGGNSLYESRGTTYPAAPAGRAYKVSYNRPFRMDTRGSFRMDITWLFNAEYPMVRWLEANGFDVSYLSGSDVERNGALLLNHKLYLSVGHDEYWSGGQRRNVEAARNAGVHLAFFSGNEMFWKTRWEKSIDAAPADYRTLTCYKETHANAKIDPSSEWTGTWRDPRFSPPGDGAQPENAVTGTIFTINGAVFNALEVPASYGNLRFWRNTSVAYAPPNSTVTFAPRTLGSEWDEDLDNGARPAGLFGVSEVTLDEPAVILDYGTNYGAGVSTHKMTLYRHPSGALVFGAGNIQYSWSLDSEHWNSDALSTPLPAPASDSRIQQATVNLFADMNVQPATLQPGLVPASASTDATPPNSSITFPAQGQPLAVGVPITVHGTAADAGGGVVAGVEFSGDHGATWHPAQGRTTWTATWVPNRVGPAIQLRSRAVDDSGYIESPGPGVTVAVNSDGTRSVWPWSFEPEAPWLGIQNQPLELGMKFKSDVDGYVTGVRFYKRRMDAGVHQGSLWDPESPATPLATGTFKSETGEGWQWLKFAAPVFIQANKVYVTSYFCPTGNFTYAKTGFSAAGVDNPPLHALKNGASGPNGLYAVSGKSVYPSASYAALNYWVDVTFVQAATPGERTLWPVQAAPATFAGQNDGGPVELGVKFRADVGGTISALRFYKGPRDTGVHTGHLWDRTGNLLAETTYGNETSQGWQQANFTQPVQIEPNTTYVASYFSPTGFFSYDVSYFTHRGQDNAPLHALRDGIDGGNGVYRYASSPAFPAQTFASLNYWADVVFTPGPAGALLPMTTRVTTDLNQVIVRPNPWRSDRHGGRPLIFDNLPPHSTVKIFTVSGHWVKTLPANGASAVWDLKNDSGDLVASGFYLYLITHDAGKTKGKFAIIR